MSDRITPDPQARRPSKSHRLVRLALAAARGEAVTSASIRERFGVSRATSKRDAALIRESMQEHRASIPAFGAFAITAMKGMR